MMMQIPHIFHVHLIGEIKIYGKKLIFSVNSVFSVANFF